MKFEIPRGNEFFDLTDSPISSPEELLGQLLYHIDTLEPIVTVSSRLEASIANTLNALKGGDKITDRPPTVSDIFNGTSPILDEFSFRYSGVLLMFVGYLSDSLISQRVKRPSISKIAFTMVEFIYPTQGMLKYLKQGGRWHLKSSQAFEKRFHRKVDILLKGTPVAPNRPWVFA